MSEKKVEIYTTVYCPYCRRAKELLNRKGIKFIEIDAEPDEARKAMIQRTGGQRTVPQVFVDGEFLAGGCDGLFERERSGELNAILGVNS
ncbi:MAG: glutaredoxin 3 [Candidatus Caenarcaniphilales bacterium]|nr:glutaredoxin 3 [Candidatus Caenarcaniphilales bacterium]